MRHWMTKIAVCLAVLVGSGSAAMGAAKPPLVLAAASLQESMTAAAAAWAARGHPTPIVSFGASSALARQIAGGAPADIFVSADEQWMDSVETKRLVLPNTRVSFLANRLVLIAPAGSRTRLTIGRGFALTRALGSGRLAMADPDAVPAGRYGKAALTALGVWRAVEPRLARGESVRAALALVERGEAPLGIVYETDAKAARGVRIVGVFPAKSHPPITYPIAVLTAATSPDAEPFRRFLISAQGKAIFRRFAFIKR
jgi:molybdate transport system substrate-binding protein